MSPPWLWFSIYSPQRVHRTVHLPPGPMEDQLTRAVRESHLQGPVRAVSIDDENTSPTRRGLHTARVADDVAT